MFRAKDLRPDQVMLAPERIVKKNYTQEENYRAYKVFSMMDVDGGGSISLRELNRVMMGDSQRYISCDFGHPDTGIIFGLDEENCVMIADIEPDSMASKYPFLIPRLRLHRINDDFYIKPFDANALQSVYLELLRCHDDPVMFEFYEPVIIINRFSSALDLEIDGDVYSVDLPVGAVYNHEIFCEKIQRILNQASYILRDIEVRFIAKKRQVIFQSEETSFRLLFGHGPNFRRSCRYALGFSSEDTNYNFIHEGQPMLMDLNLNIDADQMEILMSELFTLYDEDGSGEFEYEEFRDFYIQYLDTEESLERLKYYAAYRFRDIEREKYVVNLQQERRNKLKRRDYLKVKYEKIIEQQKQRFLQNSYVDQAGLRRRKYRHRTNDRLNYERVQEELAKEARKKEQEEKGQQDGKADDEPPYLSLTERNLSSPNLLSTRSTSTVGFHAFSTRPISPGLLPDVNHEDDIEELDELPSKPFSPDLHQPLTRMASGEVIKKLNKKPSSHIQNVSKAQLSMSAIKEEDLKAVSTSDGKVDAKDHNDAASVASSKSSRSQKSKVSQVTLDADIKFPGDMIPSTEVTVTSIDPEAILTKEERALRKRQARKEKQYQQYLKRQKVLAKILEANKALKKQEMVDAKKQKLNALSIQLLALHYLIKNTVIHSMTIRNVEDFDFMQSFNLNSETIIASPAVKITSAIFGPFFDPNTIDVENLPAKELNPAGSYYYFLRDKYFAAAMNTKHTQLIQVKAKKRNEDGSLVQGEASLQEKSVSSQVVNKKNRLGDVEFLHPAYFSTDFVRQPTRHSSVAFGYTRIMKRKMNEGIQYRMEHGIKKGYEHIPPEDIVPSKEPKREKKVRFLEVAASPDSEHGKLIGRVTVLSIKVSKLPSVHMLEKNSPFVTIQCGPWKFSTEVYSYAGSYCAWDDLNWTFRIYEPHPFNVTAYSGTVAKNVMLGQYTIATTEIIKIPLDKHDHLYIRGELVDLEHSERFKSFGECEIKLMLEKGQEWQWFMRDFDAKKNHKDSIQRQIKDFSRTMSPWDEGYMATTSATDHPHLPMTLQIMCISLFDLKESSQMKKTATTWLSSFTNTWLSKNTLESIYLVLETGAQERSTVDYTSATNRYCDETSIEWQYLCWDMLIDIPEMNLIFKVFTRHGPIGRFVLSAADIIAKLTPNLKEVEYYGDVLNQPVTDEVTGKIHIRCNVIALEESSKRKKMGLVKGRDKMYSPTTSMFFESSEGTTSASSVISGPSIEASTSQQDKSASTTSIARSVYNKTGYIPGDLIALQLPMIFILQHIEIKLSAHIKIPAPNATSLLSKLTSSVAADSNPNVELIFHYDALKEFRHIHPVKTSNGASSESKSSSSISTVKKAKNVYTFPGLHWELPLKESMALAFNVMIHHTEFGHVHLHSNEFAGFKKNVLKQDEVTFYKFLHNGKEVCGSMMIRGKATCEGDRFYVDQRLEMTQKVYKESIVGGKVKSNNSASTEPIADTSAAINDGSFFAQVKAMATPKPGVFKTSEDVVSSRNGMVMIAYDEEDAKLVPPTMLYHNNSLDFNAIQFPVILTVTEIMATDMKSVHMLKKNSPQATVACGAKAMSTKVQDSAGNDAMWLLGVDSKLVLEDAIQQVRIYIKSNQVMIGECQINIQELIASRPDNTGLRELFVYLNTEQEMNSPTKSKIASTAALSRGKVKVLYYLHSQGGVAPKIKEVAKGLAEVALQSKFAGYPVQVTVYNITALNLKAVHLFSKNSPRVKLSRMTVDANTKLYESMPLTHAGSYARWMGLQWPMIIEDEATTIFVQLQSESIVIGSVMVEAGIFLSAVPDMLGLCEIECQLSSGLIGDLSTGTVRLTFTYEPYVPKEDQFSFDDISDVEDSDEEGEEDGNAHDGASFSTFDLDSQSSLANASTNSKTSKKKRKRDVNDFADLITKLNQGTTTSIHNRAIKMVAMTAIFKLPEESTNATKFLAQSILKYPSIRIHILCGKYFSTVELMESTNNHIMSNLNMYEKFAVNKENPLKLRIYDFQGKLLGESLFAWEDFTRNKNMMDHFGYSIVEQELLHLDGEYHEIIGILRLKVKVAHFNTTTTSIWHRTGTRKVPDDIFDAANIHSPDKSVMKNGSPIRPKTAPENVAEMVEIPFHLKIQRVIVFDMIVDDALMKKRESILQQQGSSHAFAGQKLLLNLQYEQQHKSMLNLPIVELLSSKSEEKANQMEDAPTTLTHPENNVFTVEFLDDDLLYTISNEFEIWKFHFSLFPFQNIRIGEVILEVADWQKALIKPPTAEEVLANIVIREVYANIIKADHPGNIVIGRICILFQMKPIHFPTSYQPSLSNYLHSTHGKQDRFKDTYTSNARETIGHMRVKSVAVADLYQVYQLFRNSPKVTITIGHDFENMTEIAWNAGTQHRWSNLNWGKIRLFRDMTMKFKVSTGNEVIGIFTIDYKTFLQQLLLRKSAKAMMILGGDLMDGRIYKGKFEMACFVDIGEVLDDELTKMRSTVGSSTIQKHASITMEKIAEEDGEEEVEEKSERVEPTEALEANQQHEIIIEQQEKSKIHMLLQEAQQSQKQEEEDWNSIIDKVESQGSINPHINHHVSVSKEELLSSHTPTPTHCELILIGLALYDLANPPNTVYRNSPQACLSCGDWRAETDVAMFSGKSASWLFPRIKQWKLKIKGSPFIKISVLTNTNLLGISCMNLRELIAIPPDDIGISSITRELFTMDGRSSGISELKYILKLGHDHNVNVVTENLNAMNQSWISSDEQPALPSSTFANSAAQSHFSIQTHNQPAISGGVSAAPPANSVDLDELSDGFHHTHSAVEEVFPTPSLNLKQVEWPISLHIYDIHIQDIPNQHWFVDNSLSIRVKTQTDIKLSSVQVNSGSYASWNDLHWTYRVLHPEDYIGIIVSSGKKVAGSIKISMHDLLTHPRSPQGYLEISRRLQARTNSSSTTSLEGYFGKVTISMQISNIPSKEKKEKLLQIANQFFDIVSNQQQVLGIVKLKLVTISEVTTMYHQCFIQMLVGSMKGNPHARLAQQDGDDDDQSQVTTLTSEQKSKVQLEKSSLEKNLNGTIVFNVDAWQAIRVYDRLFTLFSLQSRDGDFLGNVSISSYQFLTSPVDQTSRLSVLYGELSVGMNVLGKISIAFERYDLAGYQQKLNEVQPVVITEEAYVDVNLDPPKLGNLSNINILSVDLTQLKPIHKTARNSPLVTIDYRGLRYMTDSISFAAKEAHWDELNWHIECRDLGILKLRVTSSAVELGVVNIAIKELYLLPVDDNGEFVYETVLKKKKDIMGKVKLTFYFVDSMKAKKGKKASVLNNNAESVDGSVPNDDASWDGTSHLSHITDLEALHNKILAENIEQFRKLTKKAVLPDNFLEMLNNSSEISTIFSNAADDDASYQSEYTSQYSNTEMTGTASASRTRSTYSSASSQADQDTATVTSKGSHTSSTMFSPSKSHASIAISKQSIINSSLEGSQTLMKSKGSSSIPPNASLQSLSQTNTGSVLSVASRLSDSVTDLDQPDRASSIVSDGISVGEDAFDENSIAFPSQQSYLSQTSSASTLRPATSRGTEEHPSQIIDDRTLPSLDDVVPIRLPPKLTKVPGNFKSKAMDSPYSGASSSRSYYSDGSYSGRDSSRYSDDYSSSMYSSRSEYSSASQSSMGSQTSIGSHDSYGMYDSDTASASTYTSVSQAQSSYLPSQSHNSASHAKDDEESTHSGIASFSLPPFSVASDRQDNATIYSQYTAETPMDRDHKRRRMSSSQDDNSSQSSSYTASSYSKTHTTSQSRPSSAYSTYSTQSDIESLYETPILPPKQLDIQHELAESTLPIKQVLSHSHTSLHVDPSHMTFGLDTGDVDNQQPQVSSIIDWKPQTYESAVTPVVATPSKVTLQKNGMRLISHIFDVEHLQCLPGPRIYEDDIPNPSFASSEIRLLVAEQFVDKLVSDVMGSFVAMAEGQDYDPNRRKAQSIPKMDEFHIRTGPTLHPFPYQQDSIWKPTLLHAVQITKHIFQVAGSVVLSAHMFAHQEEVRKQRSEGHIPLPRRPGIIMQRHEAAVMYNPTPDLDEDLEFEEQLAPIPLEKYYKKGVELKYLPVKAKFIVEDIIGMDMTPIDLRIMPTRPYLTACKPQSNWAAETNPIKIDISSPTFSKNTDLLLNYYNLHTKYRWEPFILRRGQVVQFDLHDAGSGLVIGKCILPFEEILDKYPEGEHEFDITVYLTFQVASEFGGGQLCAVMRTHVDLTVNLFSRSKKNDEYWKEHRAQHWTHYPLTPICFGVVRQQYKDIAEAYDQQRVIHPSFFGFKVRVRGNIEDESRFIHPIFQGFYLYKKVAESRIVSAKDQAKAMAMKSSAANPFRWDPTAHERNQCPICINGLEGCPRCFMLPTRPTDGMYYSPGELAYDPELERSMELMHEQRLTKLKTKKARKMQAIEWTKNVTVPKPLPVQALMDTDSKTTGIYHKSVLAASSVATITTGPNEDDDTSMSSAYSELSQRIERDYEEELRLIMQTEEDRLKSRPRIHTVLTTYKSLRAYRIEVQCYFNIYIKVLPAGYVRRLTCEAKDTVFALYHMFKSHSAFANCYNPRLILPTDTGLFDLHPDLAKESDLLIADNRGYDRLEEFKLNEKNVNFVLIFYKNFHPGNVSGTLQGYLNKNTEYIIPRLPLYEGVDRLPNGKISEERIQHELCRMVMKEYELQQEDFKQQLIALGKTFRGSRVAQEQEIARRDKLAVQYQEEELKALQLRFHSQLKRLEPNQRQKALKTMMEREMSKKKNRTFLSPDVMSAKFRPPTGATSATASGKKMKAITDGSRSNGSRSSRSEDDNVSLSDVQFDAASQGEDDEEEEDDGDGSSVYTSATSNSGTEEDEGEDDEEDEDEEAESQYSGATESTGKSSKSSKSSKVSKPKVPPVVTGSTVSALKGQQGFDPNNSTIQPASFMQSQNPSQQGVANVNSRQVDEMYYSEGEDEGFDEESSYYSSYASYEESLESRSLTASSNTGSGSYYSEYDTPRSYVSDSFLDEDDGTSFTSFGSESQSTYTKGDSQTSASNFYSTSSYFTSVEDTEEADDDDLDNSSMWSGSKATMESSTGSSLMPVDHITLQSYHFSKSQLQLENSQSQFNDGDSTTGIYSHANSLSDEQSQSTFFSSQEDDEESQSTHSTGGLFTYRSNISASTASSSLPMRSTMLLSHLSAQPLPAFDPSPRDAKSMYSDQTPSVYTNSLDDDSFSIGSRSESKMSDSVSLQPSYTSASQSTYTSHQPSTSTYATQSQSSGTYVSDDHSLDSRSYVDDRSVDSRSLVTGSVNSASVSPRSVHSDGSHTTMSENDHSSTTSLAYSKDSSTHLSHNLSVASKSLVSSVAPSIQSKQSMKIPPTTKLPHSDSLGSMTMSQDDSSVGSQSLSASSVGTHSVSASASASFAGSGSASSASFGGSASASSASFGGSASASASSASFGGSASVSESASGSASYSSYSVSLPSSTTSYLSKSMSSLPSQDKGYFIPDFGNNSVASKVSSKFSGYGYIDDIASTTSSRGSAVTPPSTSLPSPVERTSNPKYSSKFIQRHKRIAHVSDTMSDGGLSKVSEADDETYYSQSSRSYSSAGSVSGSSVGDASSAAEEEDNASFNSHTLDDGSMSQLSASTYSNHSKSSLRR